MEWLKEAHFDTINYPGVRHVFIQMCLPETDSVISTGSATFSKANIKNLGASRYTQFVKDTIITRVEIETKGVDGYNRLMQYFKQLTDTLSNTFQVGDNSTIVGTIERNNIPVYAILFTDKKHKKNLLVLEPVK